MIYLVKCPHCLVQQQHEMETKDGDVTCELCEKSFVIAETDDGMIHSHLDSGTVDKISKNVESYAKMTCPNCAKPLDIRNYFRNIRKLADNSCSEVVYMTVGSNAEITLHAADRKRVSIFDPEFGKVVEETA